MIYIRTEFHIPSSNGLLVIKPTAVQREFLHGSRIVILHSEYHWSSGNGRQVFGSNLGWGTGWPE
jgi:hypothetical protein